MNYLEGMFQEILTSIDSKEEVQALFFVGLCCLGAWMVLSWIVQIIRSILWIWPLVLVVVILIAVPPLRIMLTQEIIPKQVKELMHLFVQKNQNYNNETMYWYD